MIKLQKLLNFNFEEPQIITFYGSAAVGKTTLMTILTAELIKDGHKILYITDESEKLIANKLAKKLGDTPVLPNQAIIKQIYNYSSVKDYLMKIFEINGPYNSIIIDLSYNLNYDFLSSFTQKHNCSIILGRQKRTDIGDLDSFDFQYDKIKALESSSCVIIINRLKVKTLTLFERIKNFFFFWNKKSIPNTTLKIVKNRRGANTTHDINVNFEKLIIK